MESDSDGELEEFSGMELPPLINALKRILSEYPDGGQIIKELIQNAEDAGATEVKLLYDGRDINLPTGPTDKAYRKFFRGPALCVYNNAVFGERDWKGIRMIEMSIKESDPLTVGKFGLGFKSVFHLTDYPCVLSGSKLLLIDPQEPNVQKVNAMMDLKSLPDYKKRMDVDAFFTALDGTFGVGRDIITHGQYPGTLFWFPLRQTASKLSSTLYSEHKIIDLFNAIESEQISLLIFLKSLTYISLNRRTMSEGLRELTAIKIKNAAEVQKERKIFQKKSVELSNNSKGPPAQSTLEITVQCTSFSQPSDQKTTTCSWLVVNYFMGSNASGEFMALIQDKDLASSPYVSIAAPMSLGSEVKPLEGHVFCFLPLPREGTPLTGLPVHVNGFFALNQSRHHVKWLTEEQERRRVTDKDVLWNKHLIAEALPLAYAIWIEKAVQIAAQHNNDKTHVVAAHHAIPVRENVKDKWAGLLNPLFHKLKHKAFLFSHNQKKWLAKRTALFTSPEQHLTPEYCETVVKALTRMKKFHVDISDGQIETLQYYIGHNEEQMMTPILFSMFLKKDCSYQNMTSNEKMEILLYLLIKGHCHNLLGLQLLPLASEKWETFKKGTNQKIYSCSQKLLRLFPGIEDRFLLPESSYPANLRSHFDNMCQQGMFQLRKLRDNNEVEIAMLLQDVIDSHIPGTARKSLSNTKILNSQWLQEVFQHIVSHKMVSICRSVPLIPILKNRTWDMADAGLVKVSDKMILAEEGTAKLPEEVCKCLQALDVEVVPFLPEWVPINALPYHPDEGSFIQLLNHIDSSASQAQRRAIVERFNNTAESCRREFRLYLNSALPAKAKAGCIKLLKGLKIFSGRNSPKGSINLYSINERKHFTCVKTFPIQYPEVLLDGIDEERTLLHNLGAQEVSFPKLILVSLKSIQGSRFNSNDIKQFMDFFVEKYDEMQAMCDAQLLEQIISLSKQISFVECDKQYKRPSDLFNPSDDVLANFFIEEAKIPKPRCQDKTLKVLSILGLKSREHLSKQDIVTTARCLHQMSQSGNHSDSIRKKAQALMQMICLNPKYLNEIFDNQSLKTILLDLECVEVAIQPRDFPKWLPWHAHNRVVCKPSEAKDISVASLIGSVMPVVQPESQAVVEAFGWNENISECLLIAQLNKVRDCYHARHDAEVLSYLRTLYEWINTNGLTPELWREERVIWAKGEFYVPNVVIIDKTIHDTKLAPFFHYLPDTFKDFKQLFLQLGCRKNQSIDVLLTALQQIAAKHVVDRSDLAHAVLIIKKLAERNDELSSTERESILLPLHSEDIICFKLIKECTFTEDPEDFEEDDDEDDQDSPVSYNFVSKDITADVAGLLGIKTLQKRYLIDAEEITFEEYGQEEDLTTRLSRLIEEGYRDGLAVPKELLQNADDAGAKHLKFLYDERENRDAQENLLDNGMKACQGPALWVYNDARFTDKDFENIRRLNAATKEEDVQTIGKFGLGFCSVYNLTDVPSFMSGCNIVIFDPNKSHLRSVLPGNSPGLKIDLSLKGNKRLLKRNRDQFKPYVDVFGCDPFHKEQNYNGTLFRLPLRTEDEAKSSKIKNDPYTRKDMSELLHMFISNAGDLLLFMQNIKCIEFYHLYPSAGSVAEKELIVRVSRECLQWKLDSFRMTSENILSKLNTQSKEISEIQKLTIKLEVFEAVKGIKPSVEKSQDMKTSTWLVSWATGTRESKKLAQRLKNVIPLSATAVPVEEESGFPKELCQIGDGFFKDGRLYCFLPLPGLINLTGLPWHLHGCFEVSSDRRQLTIDTEQDKISLRSCWNKQLMSDAAVLAFINLLKYFIKKPLSDLYTFHMLWPVDSLTSVQAFSNDFYKYIVEEDVKIFASHRGIHSFQEIIFMNPDIRNNKSIGYIAFDMLQAFPSRSECTLVDLPTNVMKALKQSNNRATNVKIQDKTIETTEILKVFLENIDNSYWNSHIDDRNKMLLFALSFESEEVEKMIQETRCIPCEASQTLKRPNELVHPSSHVSPMFSETDTMFPSKEAFRQYIILQKLVKLGMMDNFLPIEILLGRCCSVEGLAAECGSCALQRINSILTYLDKVHNEYKDEIKQLSKIFWLPVMTKPSDWPFSWYADSNIDLKRFSDNRCQKHRGIVLVLGTPGNLHRQYDQDYIASVADLLDERSVIHIHNWNLWTLLGVNYKDGIFKKVVDQFCVIADEYNCKPKQLHACFYNIYNKIIRHINDVLSKHDNQEQLQYVQCLCDKAVVLINDEKLVCPSIVAITVQEECYPYLCKLPSPGKYSKAFFSAIGVKDHFFVADVVGALQRHRGDKTELSREEVKCNVKLLQNLVEALRNEGKSFDYYEEFHTFITGPDRNGVLHPTFELVMEDETFTTDEEMKLMHDEFPVSLGQQLGMKTKKNQCLDCISFGFPWGQKESLVTRLKNILTEYPCNQVIMKELLQNADDANAKELHFIKDYRNHPTDKFFGKPHLQGPALCVYNDSYFTECDLKGIQNLGIGSKQSDPSKIGQYGVGFNAVYHLTDTPSFLTKNPKLDDSGLLCILDPLCTNIRVNESNPGLKVPVDKLKNNFPDALTGYLESDGFFKSGSGTMFRFPLRTDASGLSSEVVTEKKLDGLLDLFIGEMQNFLLFVKKVNIIKVSSRTSSGLIQQYSVQVKISEEDEIKRDKFFDQMKAIVRENKTDLSRNLTNGNLEVSYTLRVVDSKGNFQTWLVVQRFGCQEGYTVDKRIFEAFHDKQLYHLPLGGIAVPYPDFERVLQAQPESTSSNQQCPSRENVENQSIFQRAFSYFTKPSPSDSKAFSTFTKPLSSDSRASQTICRNKNNGTLFTFLPLPVQTGFTVHINGHFCLDSSRRNLWSDGYRSIWNKLLGSTVIAHSWISAIKFFQQYFDSKKLQENGMQSWKTMNIMMEYYHHLFPLLDNLKHEFSKDVVKQVYSQVFKEEAKLFPVVMKQNKTFSVSWVALQSNDRQFGAVFNDILQTIRAKNPKQLEDDNLKQTFLLEQVLKDIGMSLIKSPMSIHSTIKELEFPDVPTATPSFVIEFMGSFQTERAGACFIGHINMNIEKTKFEHEIRLKCLVSYIAQADDFTSKLGGLPVLLTADNILHKFSEDSGIYHSPYSSLLPTSKGVFVHERFLYFYDSIELFERSLLKILSVECFQELLQREDLAEFKSGRTVLWDKKRADQLITPDWINKFFCFVVEKSSQNALETYTDLAFKHSLDCFKNWSFLPGISTTPTYELFPISMAHSLFDDSGEIRDVSRILLKVGIPTLDTSSFTSNNVKRMTKCIIANTSNVGQMLQCLNHHKTRLSNAELTTDEVEIILSYFQSHLDELKAKSYIKYLRSLPLFCTHQGSFVCLEAKSILVLPDGIPVEGLQEWAISANKTLLRRSNTLSKLFDLLGLKCLEKLEFYASTLLDTIEHLPTQHWMKHILFIKDNIDLKQFINQPYKTALLSKLKSLAFIKVGNQMKTARELHWPENEVFQHMLTEQDFPPSDVRSNAWKDFFKTLGMHFKVNDDLLLQFARDIENRGKEQVSRDTKEKSGVLLRCFLSKVRNGDAGLKGTKSWSDLTYSQIRSIKFICPYVIDKQFTDVHDHPDSMTRLICFSHSVPNKYVKICWTSANLLPDVQFQEKTKKMLQICSTPSCENVILHCQNICTSLLIKLNQGTISTSLVTDIMDNIYAFFRNNVDQNMGIFRRLDKFPVIYLPPQNTLVATEAIVTNLDQEREIEPYLYRAPTYYGQYHEMFIKIGAAEHLGLKHCLYVLQRLKSKVENSPMIPEELHVAKMALLNLIFVVEKELSHGVGDSKLFLPNRDHVLVESNQLTVSDNPFLEHMLGNKVEITYFIGFSKLDIKNQSDAASVFTKLPTALQPAILSKFVQRKVIVEEHQHIENDSRAIQLEEFLHCNEFINGILRLVKHNLSREDVIFDDDNSQQITNRIRNTKVVCISNLRTSLMYMDKLVPGSEFSCNWHIESVDVAHDDERYTFYIPEAQAITYSRTVACHWVLLLEDGLMQLMHNCTLNQLGNSSILFLLMHFEMPSEISSQLDRRDIKQLHLPQNLETSAFPRPGTYVDEQFHPFLEQAISQFNKKEYNFVAMELEDDIEEGEPTFIYVKIIRDLSNSRPGSDLSRVYLVDTGNVKSTFERVPIYRLYRFVRKQEDAGNTLAVCDEEPVNAIAFDKTCKRIRKMMQEAWALPENDRRRIIKRLKMKWHPDRNQDNKEYCTRIFNYISSVILVLEKGQQVSLVVDERTGREEPDMSESAYHNLVQHVNRRTEIYTAAYRDNIDDYNRSAISGRYCHTSTQETPRPDITEARRWMKQAKNDYRAARSYLSAAKEVEGFNWICYTCHQACEKALRAAHFTRDANKVPGQSHSLQNIVWNLDQDLIDQVEEFESRVSDDNAMRYPNAVARPDIPSDLYSEDDAEFALETTREIIEKVEETFDM